MIKMSNQKLKYEADIAALNLDCTCPPSDAEPKSAEAYRWVANPMTEACFLPPGKKNPRRVTEGKSRKTKCGLFGVSLHASQQQSMDAFRKLEASHIFLRKIMGGFVAQGTVTAGHGLCTKPNQTGHFDLYEFEKVNLKNCFVTLCEIPK
jgi:hypothetical protein